MRTTKKRDKKTDKKVIYENAFIFLHDAELDFHSYETLIPYDIEKILFEFIEDSYVAGHSKLLIITGKGRVVRPEVQRLLKGNKLVKEFKSAGYFNGQEGAFEVVLKN